MPSNPASPPPQANAGRTGHTATLLADGRVLIAGGQSGQRILATAELYDPATGKFSPTGSMSTLRWRATATRLADGRVLVAGGVGGPVQVGAVGISILATAELYDPKTGRFTPTGSMATAPVLETATLLRDGKVLVIGSGGASDSLATAEIYDPARGDFSATGSMTATQRLDTATLLVDGSVLVTGSLFDQSVPFYRPSAELYDPASGRFKPAGPMSTYRDNATATLLNDGRVLIVGGNDEGGFSLASAELYDPAVNAFSATGTTLARSGQTATWLPGGRVLVAGGGDGTRTPAASAEIYDPASGRFSATGSMGMARRAQTATLLGDGRVLIAGGEADIGGLGLLDPSSTSDLSSLASAELYDPASGTFSPTGSLTATST
ncbi:MAG: kelch repeat-containing protein [Candidatus Limnocylindrales bacterium]